MPADAKYVTISFSHAIKSDRYGEHCAGTACESSAHIPAGLVVLVQVAVRDHDALWLPGGPGGVLQVGHPVRLSGWIRGYEHIRAARIQPAKDADHASAAKLAPCQVRELQMTLNSCVMRSATSCLGQRQVRERVASNHLWSSRAARRLWSPGSLAARLETCQGRFGHCGGFCPPKRYATSAMASLVCFTCRGAGLLLVSMKQA